MLRQHNADRRRRRSYDRDIATHFLLVHIAEEFGLESFVISDPDGRLQATSTNSPSGDEVSRVLAMYSPALTGSSQTPRDVLLDTLEHEIQSIGVEWTQDEVTVREFHAEGQRMLLTTIGEPGTMREVSIYKAIMGVRRIWRETSERQAA